MKFLILFLSLLTLNVWVLSAPSDTARIRKGSSDSFQYIKHQAALDSSSTITTERPKASNPIVGNELVIGIVGGVIVLLLGWVGALFRKELARIWRIQYKRYVRQLMSEPRSNAGYFELVLRTVEADGTVTGKEESGEESQIFQVLSKMRSIHIIGKPGSGKTCALQMAVHELSKDFLNGASSKIPIFLKYQSQSDIYERILDLFHKNDLVKKKEYIDQNWLRNELVGGRFIFFIDDVHKSLLSEKYRSELNQLFEYKKNIFIIAGRDYIRRSDFNFQLYEVVPLDQKRFRNVISLHLDKSNEVDNLFRSVWYDLTLRSLYDTPQLATFLAKAFKRYGKIPLNKSKLFQEFWQSRNESELLNTNVVTRLEILSHLAFCMATSTETTFWVAEDECCTIVNQRISELNSIGKSVGAAEAEINELLVAGFLVRTEKGIMFEHDQWLEYFAAVEVYRKKISIESFPNTDSIKEVLYFATGMFDVENSADDKKQFAKFQEELSAHDIVVFNWCLRNFERERRDTLQSLAELHKDDKFSHEDIEKAYKSFIAAYRHLSQLHFPSLSKRFYPNPSQRIGAVVGIVRYDAVHNYGLRQINEDEAKEILIFTKEEMERTSMDKFFDLGVRVAHGFTTSVMYNTPQHQASNAIFAELKDLIKRNRLVESHELTQERIYFEGEALNKALKFTDDYEKGVTYKQVTENLRRRRIADVIFSKHVRNNQLDVTSFNSELTKLFSEGFEPEPPKGYTKFIGIYDRQIIDREFEQAIEKFVKDGKINPDEKIESAFPVLDKRLLFKINGFNYTLDEWNEIAKRSMLYHEKYYLNYKEMVELNFPTCKNSFPTYRQFPMHMIAVHNYDKRIAAKHVFGGISHQKHPFKMTVTSETDEKKITKLVSSYDSHWTMPFGLFTQNLFEKEPLRRGVYELIEKEFEQISRL